MKGMLQFAGTIAAVAFVLGVAGSLFATSAGWGTKFMMALMPASFAFAAALLLGARDYLQTTGAMRAVKRWLASRADVDDRDFAAHFPHSDPTLLAETRHAIAGYLDVPAEKIHPTDDLRRDLRFDAFPLAPFVVACRVLEARGVHRPQVALRIDTLTDVGRLAEAIEGLLKEDEQT